VLLYSLKSSAEAPLVKSRTGLLRRGSSFRFRLTTIRETVSRSVENVTLGLRPHATFSTSGSSYFNVTFTAVHNLYNVDLPCWLNQIVLYLPCTVYPDYPAKKTIERVFVFCFMLRVFLSSITSLPPYRMYDSK